MGSLAGESWRIKKALGSFEQVDALRPPSAGAGWWDNYTRTQGYDAFRREIPFRPNSTSGIVDLVLVGQPSELKDRVLVEEMLGIVEAFLCIKVAVRQKEISIGSWAQPRSSADGFEQVAAHIVLTSLVGTADMRSMCTVGLTACDLYPPRKYDYVTGMTDASHRVGLFSAARLCHARWTELKRVPSKQAESELRRATSKRVAKTLCREILRLCGLRECHLLQCLMNPLRGGHPDSVNDVPFKLCCVCLRKMQFLTQADLLRRFAVLPSLMAGWFPAETSSVWDAVHSAGILSVVSGTG